MMSHYALPEPSLPGGPDGRLLCCCVPSGARSGPRGDRSRRVQAAGLPARIWRSPALAVGLAIVLLPAAVHGQAVRGVVVADASHTPIPGMRVELLAGDSTVRASTMTGNAGWFQLSTGSAGRFFLRASHPEYTATGMLAVSVQEHEIVTVVVSVDISAIPLEPILVTSRSFDRLSGFRQRAAHGGLGRYILRADIERFVGARPSDLLRTVPGVRIESIRDRSGFSSDVVLMRSPGELCAPTLYVDGMRVIHGAGFDIDDLITTETVEGVEIYSSHATAPLEFHVPRDACGVIAFWSRPAPPGRLTWKRAGVGALLATLIVLLAR
jgi:hypothetical protein